MAESGVGWYLWTHSVMKVPRNLVSNGKGSTVILCLWSGLILTSLVVTNLIQVLVKSGGNVVY